MISIWNKEQDSNSVSIESLLSDSSLVVEIKLLSREAEAMCSVVVKP